MRVEGRKVMGRRVEGNGYHPPCLDVFKISMGKGVISHSSYLDVLKIMRKRKRNDLNRQIYPYLKIDLQHWSMINLLD